MEFVGIKGCKVGESLKYVYEHDMSEKEVSYFKKFVTDVFNERLFELTACPNYRFDDEIHTLVLDAQKKDFDYDLIVNGKEAPIPRSIEMKRRIYDYIWKNMGCDLLAPCYISFDEEAHILVIYSITNQVAVSKRIIEDNLEYKKDKAKKEQSSFIGKIKSFFN